jgi:predicted transcriptional regulator
MSVVNAHLMPRLSRTGCIQVDILEKLGISRQAVNQALQEATANRRKNFLW